MKKLFNLRTFNFTLLLVLIAAGIFYVAGTSDLAIQGYALSDLKEQRNRLSDENQKLELKAMTLSSYSLISGKIDNLKMVAVGEIEYINGGAGAMAKK